MNAYKKYRNSLERFLQTTRGKRSIHYAYSIGAAIVILGAMFKVLNFPFGNEIFFIGMMTEVIVFIISAFDKPAQDYAWEEVFPELTGDANQEVPTKRQITATSNFSDTTEEYKQQMEKLNKTLSGLNSIYETQLKSISSQIRTIEHVNKGLSQLENMYGGTLPDTGSIKKETEKMVEQLKSLNEVYSRMIQAMTTNPGNNNANTPQ